LLFSSDEFKAHIH